MYGSISVLVVMKLNLIVSVAVVSQKDSAASGLPKLGFRVPSGVMNMKPIFLGSCRIRYGKTTRNDFIYNPNNGLILIDFDSDFTLHYQLIGVTFRKAPQKALNKVQKMVEKFIGKDITVQQLMKAGFEHNIPEKYYV